MLGDHEGILSLEKFDGLLTHVECNQRGLSLTFEDDESFAYAKRVWDWVNGAENHEFLMVAGRGDCGDNDRRIPYLISSLSFDEAGNIAHLSGKTGEWQDLMHTYELRVGSVPVGNGLRLARRDYTKDLSVPLGANFQSKLKIKAGRIFVEFNCNPCYTEGNLDLEFIAKTELKIPVDLQFRAAPRGVKAVGNLRFELASDYDSKVDTTGIKRSLGKIPLAGASIPAILTLGPVLDFQVGFEIVGFEGGFSFTVGATAELPDSAVLQVDLLNPSNNQFSSWIPRLTYQPLQAQARIATYGKIFLDPTFALEAEFLGMVVRRFLRDTGLTQIQGNGVQTGIEFKMPYFEVRGEALVCKSPSISVSADTILIDVAPGGGACKAGDKYDAALRLRYSYGFEIKWTTGKIQDVGDFSVTLGVSTLHFPSFLASHAHL